MPTKILNFKKLRTKLIILSIIIAIIPVLILGVVSTNTITDTMNEHAQQKITNDLKVAESIVGKNLKILSVVTTESTNLEDVIYAVKTKNHTKLKRISSIIKNSTNADFVTFFDDRGNVIGRSNNDLIGDKELQSLVKKALFGEEINSIEIIDEDTIKKENLEDTVKINIINTPKSIELNKTIEKRGMALVSLVPIRDNNGHVIGAILAADILNKDYRIVDEIKNITGDTATIFLGGLRISTNVQENGKRAIGTLVSKEVYDEVINNRSTYYGRAFVVNDWYITAYEPIKNSNGEIIGMLYVGTPEKPFMALLNYIKKQIFVVGVIGLLVAWGLALLISKSITKPIEKLKEGAEKISKGEYDCRVKVESNDELGELAMAFNKMAEEIRTTHEKLKKHAKELEKSYNELKELDRLKSEIIAIVSHELRTPLTSIKGYVELVLDGTMGPLNESQRKCLEIANENINRLKRLIESMLDLSKIERGELEMRIEKINLRDSVDKVLNTLKPLASGKNVSIDCNVEDITIEGDEDKIDQVLMNLIENAIKYSPINGKVKIEGFREGDYVHIKVTDNGPGIPKKEINKIFDKFYQVDSSTKRKKGGSGLGLAVCKSIVEAHNGSIWVESKLGKGSTFHVLLPIRQNK
ncbi:cache domain-containing protein [Methanotorris formicicus]|uniref:histidine kinase n=1 Tax=Methanotorris formicicus Mc-S-70 TaxID=647171 RepID=H1KZN9_9EURY|nr:cache domain-containing protein [Methanotorris formicicus]EHP85780.1 integral membrane sensor signal transduction histidine kinase [Methanotorris formicicus Mc-S-70]